MQINYTRPLGDAWQRMKLLLLNPFQAGKWFVLGFTAWLANMDQEGGGPNFLYKLNDINDRDDFEGIGNWTQGTADSIREYLTDGTIIFLAALLVVAGLVVGLLVMWVSSRSQFMFLDNLVHDRTEISKPWNRYSRQGDSLFLWQIGYSLVVILVVGLLLGAGLMVFLPLMAMGTPTLPTILAVILAGTVFFILIVTLIFIEFFLMSFVVPIMYKENLSTTQGWNRFLELFRQHPGSFVLYGLLYAGFMIVGTMLYGIAGLLTCCVGLLLIALPYIGTVVTLPLYVTARFFDLEFLRQFGPEYDLLETPSVPEEES